jgi:hypothetical protein
VQQVRILCGLTFKLTPRAEAGVVSLGGDDLTGGANPADSACRNESGVERGVRPCRATGAAPRWMWNCWMPSWPRAHPRRPSVLSSPGAASAGTVTGKSLNDQSGVEGPNTCSSQHLRFHECPQSSHL